MVRRKPTLTMGIDSAVTVQSWSNDRSCNSQPSLLRTHRSAIVFRVQAIRHESTEVDSTLLELLINGHSSVAPAGISLKLYARIHQRVAVALVQEIFWLMLLTAYERAVYISHIVISYSSVPPDLVTRVSDRLESRSKQR